MYLFILLITHICTSLSDQCTKLARLTGYTNVPNQTNSVTII